MFNFLHNRYNATNNLDNTHVLIMENSTIALKPYLTKNASNRFNPYGTDRSALTSNNMRIDEIYDILIEWVINTKPSHKKHPNQIGKLTMEEKMKDTIFSRIAIEHRESMQT